MNNQTTMTNQIIKPMDKFIGFRFNTQNGFDHLLCAQGYNAVADNTRTVRPLPVGATVVVLAKKNDRYFAISGVATGRILDCEPKDIWDEWTVSDTKVHEVIFKTRPVLVPSELASRGTNVISAAHAEELAYFAFANG